VTVLAGQTGQLKCRVTNPANYTVSSTLDPTSHQTACFLQLYRNRSLPFIYILLFTHSI
jgi:hypothetical protein